MAVPGQLWVPPLALRDPLSFLDESSNPEKIQIITFEAFWAKNVKNDTFDHFWHTTSILSIVGLHSRKYDLKISQNVTFGPFLKLLRFYSHIEEPKSSKCQLRVPPSGSSKYLTFDDTPNWLLLSKFKGHLTLLLNPKYSKLTISGWGHFCLYGLNIQLVQVPCP